MSLEVIWESNTYKQLCDKCQHSYYEDVSAIVPLKQAAVQSESQMSSHLQRTPHMTGNLGETLFQNRDQLTFNGQCQI